MKKDVIFDFDGVIADTRDLLFSAFKDHAPTITEEDFRAHFDGNVYETPRIRFTQDAADRMHDTYCSFLSVEHLEMALDPIKRLSVDCRLFIVSSGDERGINRVLAEAGIASHFDAVYGHNTHRSKVTKFQMVRDRFDVAMQDAVFVTDTLGDVREAKHLGIRTIAETFGYHDRERLQQGQPHVIVDTWSEIEREIQRAHASTT